MFTKAKLLVKTSFPARSTLPARCVGPCNLDCMHTRAISRCIAAARARGMYQLRSWCTMVLIAVVAVMTTHGVGSPARTCVAEDARFAVAYLLSCMPLQHCRGTHRRRCNAIQAVVEVRAGRSVHFVHMDRVKRSPVHAEQAVRVSGCKCMRCNGPRFTDRVCLLAELVHSCVREPRATAFHSGGVVASLRNCLTSQTSVELNETCAAIGIPLVPANSIRAAAVALPVVDPACAARAARDVHKAKHPSGFRLSREVSLSLSRDAAGVHITAGPGEVCPSHLITQNTIIIAMRITHGCEPRAHDVHDIHHACAWVGVPTSAAAVIRVWPRHAHGGPPGYGRLMVSLHNNHINAWCLRHQVLRDTI